MMAEKRTVSVSTASTRFTGNLGSYRREFAADSLVNSSSAVNSSTEAVSPINELSKRYDRKKNRIAAQTTYPSQGAMVADVTRIRRGWFAGEISKAWTTILGVGLMFIGAALGSSWVLSREQSLTDESYHKPPVNATKQRLATGHVASSMFSESRHPDLVPAIAAAQEIKDVAMVSMKDQVAESGQLVDKFRDEADLLRTQNGSLANANAALSDETIELNQQLLELELTVLALQDKQEKDSDVKPKVVYNFVNVPIGSDPFSSDQSAYDSQTSDSQASDSQTSDSQTSNPSYSNSPAFSVASSEQIDQSQSLQQSADELSDESLDELIEMEIEKLRN